MGVVMRGGVPRGVACPSGGRKASVALAFADSRTAGIALAAMVPAILSGAIVANGCSAGVCLRQSWPDTPTRCTAAPACEGPAHAPSP